LIRTVLGDVPAGDLGVCDAHDHLFFRSAQLPGQELADADAAVGELRAFAALGGRAVVQWAPFGLGRRADQLAAVSRTAGVPAPGAAAAAGGRTRRTGGSEVLHRQPSPRLQLGLNAPA
jgi:5-phospho-D-xylono-1,4-lactonase